MEEIRNQNQQIIGGAVGPSEDLSMVMELSKRDEEARLNRLREEEEELEKVCFHQSLQSNLFFFIQVLQLSLQEK